MRKKEHIADFFVCPQGWAYCSLFAPQKEHTDKEKNLIRQKSTSFLSSLSAPFLFPMPGGEGGTHNLMILWPLEPPSGQDCSFLSSFTIIVVIRDIFFLFSPTQFRASEGNASRSATKSPMPKVACRSWRGFDVGKPEISRPLSFRVFNLTF